MDFKTTLIASCSVTMALAPGAVGADHAERGGCLGFSDLSMVLERNDTDGDTEVVAFAKGQDDGLAKLAIRAPNGRKVFGYRGDRRGIGMREFALESAEPPELALVLESFPQGEYNFEGKTVSEDCLQGVAALSHELAPTSEGDIVLRDHVTVEWAAVPQALVYLIEVKNEETDNALLVQVPAPSTSFAVPAAWLTPDTEHQVAVGVRTSTGNLTNVESFFFTASE
ncbi:MAG: hypothetical protein ACR2RB_15875 [Gammaproteobacteria bacterium]